MGKREESMDLFVKVALALMIGAAMVWLIAMATGK